MSRSNPAERAANPATRWYEWDGEDGVVRYYDKATKQTVVVGADFPFVLLDELGTVKGWHDASQSGIYSNEVKDTREQPLLVKAFKGGILASGLYRDIKDRVHTVGGKFTANCYILYYDAKAYQLGVLQFKGSALNAWTEFRKAHRSEVYEQGVRIKGFTEGKKGKITFRVPKFTLVSLTPDAQAQAVEADKTLQAYLRARQAPPVEPEEATYDSRQPEHVQHDEVTDDEIPF